MLKESKDTTLEYQRLSKEEMESRGILGRLVGVCADFISPTRNGRKYPEKLWENVFADPIMKERIENGVCYGELGHPADREETDMEKIALCLAEVPKKGTDGKLRAVFDILNTPNGRILKSLCDYGSTIGISSRGSGDLETDFDGNESVNPDTYNCEGFDAVLIPAVKEARLQYVTESLNKTRYNKTLRDKLTESINKEDEKHQKIMVESLNTFGINLLDEKLFVATELQSDNTEASELIDSDKLQVANSDILDKAILDVMCAYQNANKWLDTIKEYLYTTLSCPFFSSYVHTIAHKMPERFDKFGEILHTENIQTPYPATIELDTELNSVSDVFEVIFETLDSIKNTLNNFIKITDEEHHGMACAAETLLNDIETEYPMLFRLNDKWKQCDENMIEFDKYVMQYVEHKDSLIESVSKVNINISQFPEIVQNEIKAELIGKLTNEGFNSGQIKEMVETALAGRLVDIEDYIDISKFIDLNENLDAKLFEDFDEDITQETDNINKEDSVEYVEDNSLAMFEELQRAIRLNKKLDEKIINLQEKLSVSYTKEISMKEELEKYKTTISKLSKKSKQVESLTEKLNLVIKEKNTSDINRQKLSESISKKNNVVKTLKESIEKQSDKIKTLTEEMKSINSQYDELNSQYDELNNSYNQLKESYSKKVEKQNKLIEKYQNIAVKSVNKYIDMQAIRLGISSSEIKNRLPESYSFTDIDSICENLQEYKINMSNLPFSTLNSLNEGVTLKVKNPDSRTLVPQLDEGIDELTLRLAGLI